MAEATEKEGGLHPAKYAEYFANMSPLAARIYADIRKVETKTENFEGLSYDKKCAVIDKNLCPGGKDNGTSHTAAVVTAAIPQLNPEGMPRFSACTEAQSKACGLEKLFKKISLQQKKVQRVFSSRKAKAPAPQPLPSKESFDSIGSEEHAIQSATNFGISFGDFENGYQNGKNHHEEPKLEDHPEEPEESYPVQNSGLIAELQAKLNRNKLNGRGISSGNESPALSKHIISKPRAPPPPPPSAVSNPTITKGQQQDDFKVDVSSPCKIATPKTGFDFLDNW